jgi:RHS repeat-associated protein
VPFSKSRRWTAVALGAVAALLATSLGAAVPAGADTSSHASALAARRAVVRTDISSAAQSSKSSVVSRVADEVRAMSASGRRSAAERARSLASQRGSSSASPSDAGGIEGMPIYSWLLAPDGGVIETCFVTCTTEDTLYAGEAVTAQSAVFNNTLDPSYDVDVSVLFQEECGDSSLVTLGTDVVDAPSAYVGDTQGEGAVASVSFTVPSTCPGATSGLQAFNLEVSATPVGVADPLTGGGGWESYWSPVISAAQLAACGCSTDSADPGSQAAEAGDPVDTVSGAYADTAVDASLQSPGYPLTISRSYSSADTASGPLGVGWSVPWSANLSITASTGDVTFTAENGDRYVYVPEGDGFYAPTGSRSVLTEVTNSSGDVTGYRLTDPADHAVLSFNASGVLGSETDATGRGLTFTYNASGQVSSITDAAGQSVTLVYVGALLSEVKLPSGKAISYGYLGGHLASVETPSGSTTGTAGAFTYYTYTSSGLLASVEDADGQRVVDNTYNSAGQVTSQQDGLGNVANFSYTATSNGLSETDVTAPDGGIITYLYGGGMLLEEIGPVQDATSQYEYNIFGEPTSVTDPLGRITNYAYDAAGDLTSETSDLGYTQYWTYDGSGNALTYENADYQTSTFTYNAMDEVLTAATAGGQEAQYTYNANGSPASETSARGHATKYTYFSDGMLESVTNPDGDVTSYTYDAMGYPLTATDPMGHETTYAYNSAEELASVQAPVGGTTYYGYDADGNLTSRGDPDSNTWKYLYDADGELSGATDPLGHADSYKYDGDGNQSSYTDARGIVTSTTYSLADLPETVSYSDATASVSYKYDADGEPTSITDGTGTRALTYNADGELTGEGGFGYGYDEAGNLTSRQYPDGTTTTYGYNENGQVSSMTVGSAQTTYTYDADGDLLSSLSPDGVTQSRVYDDADQLTALSYASSSSTLDSYGLTLNADAQPTAIAVTQDAIVQPTRYYGYDNDGRLTSVTTSGNATSYGYDAAGNLTSSETGGVTITDAYNADEELTASTTGAATTSSYGYGYGYDADGNQTSAGATAYTFNAANELTGATSANGDFTYSYDNAGDLAKTDLNGTELTGTVWDLNNPLPEVAEDTSSAGAVTSDYAWNPAGTLNSQTKGGATYDAVTDWEGSLTGLINSSGAQENNTTYTAYGAASTSGSVTSSIGYTGSYTLNGSGLDDQRARDYDPATGQFSSVDPLLSDTDQPYAYAADDPVHLTDPSGEIFGWDNLVAGGIAALVGAGGQLLSDLVYDKPVNWVDISIAAGTGFTAGFLADECGLCAAPLLGAETSAAGSIASQLYDDGSVDPLTVVGAAALGWEMGGYDSSYASEDGEDASGSASAAATAGLHSAPMDLAVGAADPVNFYANIQNLLCAGLVAP